MRWNQFAVVLVLAAVPAFAPTAEGPRGERWAGPDEKSGVVLGIVTEVYPDKARFSIKTKEGVPRTFVPRWVGGLPAEGGGPDKEMAACIAKLQPGMKVEVGWEWADQYRVVRLRVAGHQEGGDKPHFADKGQPPAAPNPIACDLDPAVPAERQGIARGQVCAVDPKGRLVLKTETGEEKVFVPRWVGGMPGEGGGFDAQMVACIAGLKTGQKVEVCWEWDERARCSKISPLGN